MKINVNGETFETFEDYQLTAFVDNFERDYDAAAVVSECTTAVVYGGHGVRVWRNVDGDTITADEVACICEENRVYGWLCVDDGTPLEWDGDAWTCPHCGCSSIYPSEDGCTPLYTTADVDPLRFSGNYEDVFIEDGHYLYVCREAGAYGHGYACNEYHKHGAADGDPLTWLFVRYDTAETSVNYLRGLKHAPADVARAVIILETNRRLEFSDMDEDEKEAYSEYTRERLDDEIRALA